MEKRLVLRVASNLRHECRIGDENKLPILPNVALYECSTRMSVETGDKSVCLLVETLVSLDILSRKCGTYPGKII